MDSWPPHLSFLLPYSSTEPSIERASLLGPVLSFSMWCWCKEGDTFQEDELRYSGLSLGIFEVPSVSPFETLSQARTFYISAEYPNASPQLLRL